MADTGLRMATQPFAVPTAVVRKAEVRASTDPLVTANPQYWATIDTVTHSTGAYVFLQVRG